MKLKLDGSSVPEHIQKKIRDLNTLLDHADSLRNDILEWYEDELKSYDSTADTEDELFDPGNGVAIEGISYHAVMEALCVLQAFNESRAEKRG